MSSIIKYNKDEIISVLNSKIGTLKSGFPNGIGEINDFSGSNRNIKTGWFYNDKRNDYSNYLTYVDDLYGKNQIWADNALGVNSVDYLYSYLFGNDSTLGDTKIGQLSKETLKKTVSKTYNQKKEKGVNGISKKLNYELSLNGYIDGLDIRINPKTGRVDPIDFTFGANAFQDLGPLSKMYVSSGYPFYTDLGTLSLNALLNVERNLSLRYYNPWNTYFDQMIFPSETLYNKTILSYSELGKTDLIHNESGQKFNTFQSITNENLLSNDLLYKTNQTFLSGQNKNLIARFFTGAKDGDATMTQTGVNNTYGLSKGRNLLAKEAKDVNDYLNPYCRVWTYHHQYSKHNDTIRPFEKRTKDNAQSTFSKENNWQTFRAKFNDSDGAKTLEKNTVLDYQNGLVRITPFSDGDFSDNREQLKKCMFSIENLAWVGVNDKNGSVNTLTDDQRGPFGGRIMWFPPYDLTFNENINVGWNSTEFIGRGEKIYTYTNTERSGTLGFKLLIDHPSILDYWEGRKGNVEGKQVKDEELENSLLRFFAGCEILNAGPETSKIKYKKKKPEPPKIIPKTPEVGEFKFYVFFPNNYSGVDDIGENSMETDENPDWPIMYLLNGTGTQKYYDHTTKTVTDLPTVTDINNYFNLKISVDKNETTGGILSGVTSSSVLGLVGGYEMRKENGISLVNSNFTDGVGIVTSGDSENLAYSIIKENNNYYDIVSYSLPDIINNNKYNRWYYRIDEFYTKKGGYETLGKNDSYADTKSFGLNSKQGRAVLQDILGLDSEVTLFSFSDVAKTLYMDKANQFEDYYYSNENVKNLTKILVEKEIKKIIVKGYASSHGDKERNAELAENRANTITKWLRLYLINDEYIYEVSSTTDVPKVGNDNVSDVKAKFYRSVEVTVKYSDKEEKTETTKLSTTSQDNFISGNTISLHEQSVTDEDINNTLSQLESDGAFDIEVIGKGNGSYGNEFKFFDRLKHESPLLRDKITEKIKYFDPAFHSISPEGFNSRLTFLHQCTRQGPTISHTQNQTNAFNLAFGKSPVCVLRVGDFFYTKVIFDSITINYDPLQWDLNQEGAGVQPMIAQVDINFKFLGGSDLNGPISRLQNAVSFNYYANASVYDNRAEEATYEKNSSKIKTIKNNKIQ